MAGYIAVYDLLQSAAFRYVVSVPLGQPTENHVLETWAGPRGDLVLDVEDGEIAAVLCRVPDALCMSPGACPFGPRAQHAPSAHFDLVRELEASLKGCEL